MKCKNCKKEIEKNIKPIKSISAICKKYNPNHLCKECRNIQSVMKKKLKEWYEI